MWRQAANRHPAAGPAVRRAEHLLRSRVLDRLGHSVAGRCVSDQCGRQDVARSSYIRQLHERCASRRSKRSSSRKRKSTACRWSGPIRLTLLPHAREAAASARSARRQAWRSRCGACECGTGLGACDAPPGAAPDIKLFVLYHDPAISPVAPAFGGPAERPVRRRPRVRGRRHERLERHGHRARAAAHARRDRQVRPAQQSAGASRWLSPSRIASRCIRSRSPN